LGLSSKQVSTVGLQTLMVERISVQTIVGVGRNGRVKGNRNKAWTAGFGGNPDEGNWQI
jgi:hypothetical protein